MEIKDETIRDLIMAIDRLRESIDRRQSRKSVPINGIRWRPKDPTGAERARRYRDRHRTKKSGSLPDDGYIVAID